MFENDKKINDLFLYWLFSSLVLVFFIIIIGGLTRLTNSGLSITEWELFSGILPPLNNNSWLIYFNQYKEIPQYKLINPNMKLDDFKFIFYWEYFHRMIARLIGLFFLIPLIYFYFSKKINIIYLKICYLIFFLIVLQGIFGWYMVKSGLVYDVTVSHYRLSIHLTTAIIIISIIFWLLKNFISKCNKKFFTFSKKNLPFQIFISLIFIQIIAGSFVSGLDAGKIYQTWPLMGNNYFPDDFIFSSFINLFEFSNLSLVQFYHRNLAYLIILYGLFLFIYIYKNNLKNLYKSSKIMIFFLLLQVMIGVLTLVSGLNIYLSSIHQIIGVILVLSALNLYHIKLNKLN
jgi:heme a synthase